MWRFPNLAEPACFLPLEHISILVFSTTHLGNTKGCLWFSMQLHHCIHFKWFNRLQEVLQTKSLPCGDLQHMTHREYRVCGKPRVS